MRSAGRVAVIGEPAAVVGYGLAGALVRPAEDQHEVQSAWDALPQDVVVVILTAQAAADLPVAAPSATTRSATTPSATTRSATTRSATMPLVVVIGG